MGDNFDCFINNTFIHSRVDFAAHRLNNRYGKLQIGNLARVKATQLRQWDIVHETRSIDEQTSFDYISP